MDNSEIANQIRQVGVLLEEPRLKILIALYNSELFKIDDAKIGERSHTITELVSITEIKPRDLENHLKVLINSHLVKKDEDDKKYYHITNDGKEILKEFGISKKIVMKLGEELGYKITEAS